MMFASKGFFFISHDRMNLYTHFLEKSTYFFKLKLKPVLMIALGLLLMTDPMHPVLN